LINKNMEEGKLVPGEIIINLLKKAIEKNGWASKKYLIDGFPRSQDNLDGWNKILGETVEVPFALSLDADEAAMTARILERAKSSGRVDDNVESLKLRFATFKTESVPVVKDFELKGKLKRVNSLRAINDVFSNVINCFNEYFLPKPTVFFVLGGPGCGKGTQCTKLVQNYGFCHLSAGDLLREERDSGSEMATLINKYMLDGKLVPGEVTIELIKMALHKHGWSAKKFLIDGFPRSQENLDGWNKDVASLVEVPFAFFLDADEKAMTARILKRAEVSGRVDDNVDSLKLRFATFK
jgi:adenylate kinase family enzyme